MLTEEAQTNKAHKDKLNAAADKLEKNLSQCVVAAKGVLQNPDDADSQEALSASVADITASLTTIAAATSPSGPLAEIEAAAATQAAALHALKNNPNQEQLREVTENQNKLNELVNQETSKPEVPKESAAALAEELKELNNTIASVESAVKAGDNDAVASACVAAQTPLARIADTAQLVQLTSPEDEPKVVEDAKQKAAVLLSALKQSKAGNMDINSIMNSSQQLARTLSDLVGHTRALAYLTRDAGGLSDAAQNALALDELITTLENVGAPATAAQAVAVSSTMDSLISSIGNEQLATISAPTIEEAPAPAPVPAPKPKQPKQPKNAPPQKLTLDESLKQVANDIRAAVAPVTETANATGATANSAVASSATNSLATELERLAMAAQHNKRQDVLVCGRTISALVTQLYESLRQTAKESTNPLVQDKLYKSSQALKNFAIQLKILASVKAASNVDDSDADEQLGTLTRALGAALGEGLKAVDIHNRTSRKK